MLITKNLDKVRTKNTLSSLDVKINEFLRKELGADFNNDNQIFKILAANGLRRDPFKYNFREWNKMTSNLSGNDKFGLIAKFVFLSYGLSEGIVNKRNSPNWLSELGFSRYSLSKSKLVPNNFKKKILHKGLNNLLEADKFGFYNPRNAELISHICYSLGKSSKGYEYKKNIEKYTKIEEINSIIEKIDEKNYRKIIPLLRLKKQFGDKSEYNNTRIGKSYLKSNIKSKNKRALTYLLKSYKMGNEHPIHLSLVGRSYFKIGDFKNSSKFLKKAIESGDNSKETYIRCSMCANKLGNIEDEIKYLEKGVLELANTSRGKYKQKDLTIFTRSICDAYNSIEKHSQVSNVDLFEDRLSEIENKINHYLENRIDYDIVFKHDIEESK
ncbi:MAG: hypothetical protein PF569_02770 [Candidatus Woesearchaeota archaeon]|jgi:tetratricopeptide (TPR) repeat protein|nr:hypothetical protein [Candidatus Woesearchaeota archaeon]